MTTTYHNLSVAQRRFNSAARVTDPHLSSRQPSNVIDGDYCLIDRLRQGDLDAFEALVEKYKQPIINFAARFLGDPVEAHDVAQNVVIRVFKRSDRFQFHSKVSTWLYTITRNLCHNEYRRRVRQRTEPFDLVNSQDPTTGQTPETTYQWELEQKIEESLASLPAKQRAAILLLQEQDLSYGEIGVALGTSVSATKALIHRARQELKRQLRPYLLTGAWPAKPKNRGVLEFSPSEGFRRRLSQVLSVTAVAEERRRAA